MLWVLAELAGIPREAFDESTKPEVSAAMAVHDEQVWFRHGRLLRSLDQAARQAALTDAGWFRFSVVRDPARRLWSAWQSKLLLREPVYYGFHHERAWYPQRPEDPQTGAERLPGLRRRAGGRLRHRDAHARPALGSSERGGQRARIDPPRPVRVAGRHLGPPRRTRGRSGTHPGAVAARERHAAAVPPAGVRPRGRRHRAAAVCSRLRRFRIRATAGLDGFGVRHRGAGVVGARRRELRPDERPDRQTPTHLCAGHRVPQPAGRHPPADGRARGPGHVE